MKFPSVINRTAHGFTLLEVMVAIAILAIALTAIISSQSRTVSIAETHDFARVSAYLAERQMAELVQGGPDRPSAGRFAEPFESYSWRTEIVETPQVEIEPVRIPSRLERITLEISDTRRDRTFTLRRYRLWTGVR